MIKTLSLQQKDLFLFNKKKMQIFSISLLSLSGKNSMLFTNFIENFVFCCLTMFSLLWVFLPLGATYCVCKDGGTDQALQKTLDYACGAGADCAPITQNGVCYNPNTLKAHCDYAVNSYFQKKNQAVGSCDFSGTATQTSTAPSGKFCFKILLICLELS